MERKKEKDLRFMIAERFYQAIEKIIKERKAVNYRDIERQTGIEHQRINAIKAYVLKGRRPSYPGLDYIYLLESIFGVNSRWLIMGLGPFYVVSDYPVLDEYVLSDRDMEMNKNPLSDRMKVLEDKLRGIEKKIGY